MQPHSDEVSISANSVFDWGHASIVRGRGRPGVGVGGRSNSSQSVGSNGSGGTGTTGATGANGASAGGEEARMSNSSRYDPAAMSRIVDITDLVDESSDNEDSDEDIHIGSRGIGGISGAIGAMQVKTKGGSDGSNHKSGGGKKRIGYGPGGNGFLMCKQIIILAALVMIIVGASIGIGLAVLSGDPSKASMRSGGKSEADQQQLLELAERVITACAPSALDTDMKNCQSLCHSNMCCFESGEYNCENDEKKNCAVYAGCEALVEGVIYNEDEGAVVDEEQN